MSSDKCTCRTRFGTFCRELVPILRHQQMPFQDSGTVDEKPSFCGLSPGKEFEARQTGQMGCPGRSTMPSYRASNCTKDHTSGCFSISHFPGKAPTLIFVVSSRVRLFFINFPFTHNTGEHGALLDGTASYIGIIQKAKCLLHLGSFLMWRWQQRHKCQHVADSCNAMCLQTENQRWVFSSLIATSRVLLG